MRPATAVVAATAAGAAVLAVTVVASCSDRTVPAAAFAPLPAAIGEQRPDWKDCPEADGFQCASVRVPRDHTAAGDATLRLALARRPATDAGRRLGALVFLPGGPGHSGIDLLARSVDRYAELGTRYDLVAVDPRGTGRSTPVTCLTGTALEEYTAADPTPDDAAERSAHADRARAFGRACQDGSGDLLASLGTPQAARDLEVVRRVLGEDRLNVHGSGHGSWIAASYAHHEPRRVGRFVLDGPVDPGLTGVDHALNRAAALHAALDAFAASCREQGERACPLGPDAAATTGDLLARLDGTPLRAQPHRPLTEGRATAALTAALPDRRMWPMLAQGLTEAVEDGNGTTLGALADAGLGRAPDGRTTGHLGAETAVTCVDTADRHSVGQIAALLPRFRKASPVLGTAMAWTLARCTDWPAPADRAGHEAASRAAHDVAAPSAPPILVVGRTDDPATPHAWAPALVRRMGGEATLLTVRTAADATCPRTTVEGYLLEGTVPEDGSVCA